MALVQMLDLHFRIEAHFQIETLFLVKGRFRTEGRFRIEGRFRTEVEAVGAVDVDSEEGDAEDQTLEEVVGTIAEIFHRQIGIGMVEI